ncbi:MAG TPA: glycoside hydrolase [bacterium]|nr:glycoside hydrolase [bacterium]HPN42956.1 glycoside hydrolase [bacterium]
MKKVLLLVTLVFPGLITTGQVTAADQTSVVKRIYICPDDHTDMMWTADTLTYRNEMLKMLDYYLYLADSTENNPVNFQSRWNCDCSNWLRFYEKYRTPQQFQRLVERIQDGHISVMKNIENANYGGMPAEAVLRELYYAGSLERRYNISFPMAMAQENQTLACGLPSLWSGAGIKYSWRGVCDCATQIPKSGDREHPIYWWTGPDGGKILLKWYSLQGRGDNQSLGGYAEAHNPYRAIDLCDSLCMTPGYPYNIAAAFGYGWDALSSYTNSFIKAAQQKTNAERQVIVSNQVDFFRDFEKNYGAELPEVCVSYGNEWDILTASLAEVTSASKRAVEKLRSAEAMATLVSLQKPAFMQPFAHEGMQAWVNMGLYWEHDWTADSPVIPRNDRANWARDLSRQINNYVDKLLAESVSELGGMIANPEHKERFFVFNPLNWSRTDIADVNYTDKLPVSVIDLSTGKPAFSQVVNIDGKQLLRILATDVPGVGYKVFEIIHKQTKIDNKGFKVDAANGMMENEFYRLKINSNGAITSIIDKTRANREMVQTVNGYVMNDLGPGQGALSVENAGPVSVTLKAVGAEPLQHTTRITLFRNSARIDISNEITRNFKEVVTWKYAFNLDSPDIWHEETGAILRAKLQSAGGHYSDRANNSRYDWLTMNHFAYISDPQGMGVTLSNRDCSFMQIGNSTVASLDSETPLISVLAGGQVDGPTLGIPDQGGDSYFLQRFALRSHSQFSKVQAMKFALEHQNPFTTGPVSGGSAYPEKQFSLLQISDPAIILWALKPHEDGIRENGIVLRGWNLDDRDKEFTIQTIDNTLKSAHQLSHVETPLTEIKTTVNKVKTTINARQMQTIGLQIK